MNRFTSVVAGLLLLGAYPIYAQDISVEDTVNFDLRAIGQTQGAGVPNAIGAGAFIPLHKTPNAVTYVDIEAKANLDDRSDASRAIRGSLISSYNGRLLTKISLFIHSLTQNYS